MIPSPSYEIEATLYGVVPEALATPRASEWALGVLGVDQIGSFLEGPCITPDGRIFVSDLAHGRILEFDDHGNVEVFLDYDGEPNGLALGGNGRIYIADYRRGLLSLGIQDRQLRPVVTRHRLEPFRGLSDLAFGLDGALYFSDQGQSDLRHPTGRVFRLSANGVLEVLLEGVPSPNGIAVTPDGSTVYVAVTRANCVYRIPLRPSGQVGKVGVHFYSAGGSGGPDGLAVAADGSLVVAQYGAGRAWICDPLGLVAGSVRTPSGLGITNIAFDPRTPGTLYLTEADTGSLWKAETPLAGATLFSACDSMP